MVPFGGNHAIGYPPQPIVLFAPSIAGHAIAVSDPPAPVPASAVDARELEAVPPAKSPSAATAPSANPNRRVIFISITSLPWTGGRRPRFPPYGSLPAPRRA